MPEGNIIENDNILVNNDAENVDNTWVWYIFSDEGLIVITAHENVTLFDLVQTRIN